MADVENNVSSSQNTPDVSGAIPEDLPAGGALSDSTCVERDGSLASDGAVGDGNEAAVSKVNQNVPGNVAPADRASKQSEGKPNKTKWIVIAVIVVIIVAAAIGSQSQPADVAALEDAIEEAEQTYTLGQGDYTDESWELFVSAYDNAQSLLDDNSASQSDVDEAEEALSSAANGLELKPVDKSSLTSAVSTYSTYAEGDYTPETWQPFADALSHAQEVESDEEATQAEVDSASSSLTSAAINLVEAFDPNDYSSVAFSDLARNPDAYMGQKIVVSGRVLQVVEGSTETNLRIATDGEYDDIVFVGFDPSIIDYHILEDDNVTIYGTCIGQFSYESTLGATISLPGIYGEQVVLN